MVINVEEKFLIQNTAFGAQHAIMNLTLFGNMTWKKIMIQIETNKQQSISKNEQ